MFATWKRTWGARPNPVSRIFFLTLFENNFIYESHCGPSWDRKSDVRENQSMKNAAKKTAKKAAKKGGAKKKK